LRNGEGMGDYLSVEIRHKMDLEGDLSEIESDYEGEYDLKFQSSIDDKEEIRDFFNEIIAEIQDQETQNLSMDERTIYKYLKC
jgi:hypothetical protein